ncbi:MAG: CBS domain-containing protein [Candidatus Odinarchaeum yellowstonii]|uniref:CBS domain-containing protein n=1 Tax=Odinarchaeota yellowstonii (strain LCB_4) TaxID=1841599 RepID=A0AAF0D2Z8_ODILC|nr:MAG: CBS domain-containing protein [Candidatus Odinarchaeum yellowstonii]
MKASDIMNSIIAVDKDSFISEAINLMDKHKLTHILVTDKNKIIGYCSDLNLVDRLGSSRLKSFSTKSIRVSSVMESFNKFVDASENIRNIADKMICEGETIYLVGSEGDPLGFITMHDFAKACGNLTEIKITGNYSTVGPSARASDRLVNLRNILIENKLTPAAPILEGDKLIGLLDIKMLARKLAVFRNTVPEKHQEENIRRLLVFDAMLQNPPTLTPNSSISEASEIFSSKLVYGIPVLDKGKLMGVFHILDLVKWVQNKY